MSETLQGSEIETFLDSLCSAAAEQTLPLFRTTIPVANKEKRGFDPVTEADRAAEMAIRNLIGRRYPDHGIIGEEFGSENEQARHQWIIDPIDGTRAFITGIPVWGTLIALYEDGRPRAGAMDQPFTGERFTGIDGNATFKKDGVEGKLQSSRVARLCDATMLTTDPNLFSGAEREQYDRLSSAMQLNRYSTDCYGYCMVAAGQADLVLESGLSIYDIAALIPIVEGAGGVLTDWSGGDATGGGSILAAANAELHSAAIRMLKG